MHQDDRPVGRPLSRRELVGLLGLSGVALLAGRAAGQPAPPCVVRPRQSAGPFFVDAQLERSDIRTDPATGTATAGLPLQLAFAVSQLTGGACAPLAGAQVDVWHCDALGVYSDVAGWGLDTRGRKFLRGYQVTDEAGQARFTTIYPGAYPGRAVHIHFTVRTRPAAGPGVEFTSQIYFDDAVTDRVHRQPPYAGPGAPRTRNDRDGLFRDGGRQLLVPVTEQGAGYAGTFALALTSARRG